MKGRKGRKSGRDRQGRGTKSVRVLEGECGEVQVRLSARLANDEGVLMKAVAAATGWEEGDVGSVRIVRRNIDARRSPVQLVMTVLVCRSGCSLPEMLSPQWSAPTLSHDAPEVLIVGAGPAGLFAALECLQRGTRPVVLERGQSVRQRRRDLVQITREQRVNPDSNYCFGEGGAGTYSDGKLYTRSHKRGDIRASLECLVAFGADPDILIDAHPHIGTNKLPGIIESMRTAIEEHGGRVHFGRRVVDIQTSGNVCGVQSVQWEDVATGDRGSQHSGAIILATGHSARDVFSLLHRKGWVLEAKPFAMGVRIEHPQSTIDQAQYHGEERGDWLPAAAYRLVCQVDDRGVHSFCMCPGGIIAPCATGGEEVVTNGWSPSKRNNPFANAGMVVQLDPSVWESAGFKGPLGAMNFQAEVERMCWEAAGKTQHAPAQRLLDYLHGSAGRISDSLPECSYLPGITSVNLRTLLPASIADPLAEGFRTFGRQMPAFLHPDAVLVAPESRTSSPIRIPRDPKSLEHPDVAGLYPCGEGGGYAGGILSAALDGIRVAQAASNRLLQIRSDSSESGAV